MSALVRAGEVAPRAGCFRRHAAGATPGPAISFSRSKPMTHRFTTALSRLRRSAGALRGFALLAALLFSAGAQADPAVAQQLLSTIRTERMKFEMDMQMANYYLDNNPSQAQIALSIARADAIMLTNKLMQLESAHKDSRANGQYRDLQALERAIAEADSAQKRMQMASSYLMNLQLERPPSAITRFLLDGQLQMFERDMQELEQAMSQA
ncbi:hypothetical protein J5226_22975 [Lysobacter sp. K5869]|uniref:hypothetical protein n=1 Tax=Lysobacter sp. K5869 TaxID=2820808 RepID=UPI001C05FF9A|nr:hypothetical protein [Lysobacter sp. K5869]QWP76413.1 hypothetical protein J5226_22975 [Lysobacter sp. K5869]